ncbi:MAG: carboxylesterase family protein, partial [Solobacterium sp.]|nr:carboxylesterase family protein [Solobacterium sp.]
REIYDPVSDAWYWLDAEADGAKAVDKEVWMPYVINGEEPGSTNGKWVRYDAEGIMIKGFRRIGDHYYYYDPITGAGADGEFLTSGNNYSGVNYWYEKGERQGTVNDPQGVVGDGLVRGREIYDPLTDAWYWLDANDKGAPAMNKQVWMPYVFQGEEPGSTDGKWVRYNAGGGMIKGWYRNEDGIYYYDPITGAMAKGEVKIDGKKYTFDPVTGIAQGNIDVEVDLDTVPTANVTGGRIAGFIDANGVKTFLGIPYADTTAGENRFADPKDVVPWSGEKNCAKFGSIGLEVLQDPFMCWSKEYVDWGLTYDNGRMDEDLLNLNVWTKANKGDKKPVIVYIHGGGNTSGSGQNEVYSGANIVNKDVVYVTINYRYGLQGFLCFKDEEGNEITGNFALKDMVKALEWVRDNIAEFGGDPDNVTISGQSAGSANVQKLMICPKAAGLFKHAVAMSANSYEGFGPMRGIDKQTAQEEAAQALKGYTVEQLRSMTTEEIHKLRDVYNPSSMVIDNEWLLDSQVGAYATGDFNHVDFMTGCVTGDTVLFGSFLTLPDDATEWTKESYEKAALNAVGADKLDRFLELYPAEGDLNELVAQLAVDMSNAQYAIAQQAKAKNDGDAKNYQWYFTRVVPDK